MSGVKRGLSPDREDDASGKRSRGDERSRYDDDAAYRRPSPSSSVLSPSSASVGSSSQPPTPSSSSFSYPSPPPPSAYAAAGGGSTSAPASDEEVRLLIDNSQVGGLIGRGGTNVSSIREQSGAHVSILKMDPRAQDGGMVQKERIATVKGADDAVVKAIKLIADILVSSSSSTSRREGDSGVSNETSVRLLVQQSRVDAVIGPGGLTVRQTQQQTGARVSVSTDPLPGSTEKEIVIGGTPGVIQAAFLRIHEQLKAQPLKEGSVIPYTPTVTSAGGHAVAPSAYPPHPPMPSQYPPPPPGYPPYPPQPGYPPMPPTGYPPYPPPPGAAGAPPYPYPPYYPPPPSQYPGHRPPYPSPYPHVGPPIREAPVSQKIAIPTVCSGCVLGKGGSIIKELRAQSGTNISLADPEPSTPNERVVTITGTPAAIQHAIQLIREAVEKYQPPAGSFRS